MKESTPLWCEDCRFVSFETGLEKPMLTLNDPNGFKNTTNVYSIHLELRMAYPCQISTGKWKYVNPSLDFLGVPDQRTAYVKRQARPRWTYVRRSSVTPDLLTRKQKRPRVNSLVCDRVASFCAVGPHEVLFTSVATLRRLVREIATKLWDHWLIAIESHHMK